MTSLIFPEFDDIPVSTKTFIITTNLSFDIMKMFEILPCTQYIVVPKRRGRKKKIVHIDPNYGIPSGSIITLEFEGSIRGVDLKSKKNKKGKKSSSFFRNSVSIVMIIEDKHVNLKVSRNGKLQMTGCKNDLHAELVVKYIWEYIKIYEDIYKFTTSDSNFKAIFIPAMRNIDFSLGFNVNREELDSYINEETEFHSLLETSFGYTGVNIKIPLDFNLNNLIVKQIVYLNDEWILSNVLYKTYLDLLPIKEKEKKSLKKRFNTFLVFHSGKIIMSGICAESQKNTYYSFLNIIRDSYDKIKEKLEEYPTKESKESKECINKHKICIYDSPIIYNQIPSQYPDLIELD